MRRLNGGLLWLVIAALAFAAVLAFHPGTASAQGELAVACEPPGGALNQKPPGLTEITNIKKPDLAIVDANSYKVGPGPDMIQGNADDEFDDLGPIANAIFSKAPYGLNTTIAKVKGLQGPGGAIQKILDEYQARGHRLNVVIADHGAPGEQSIGDTANTPLDTNVIGHNSALQTTNQDKFIQAVAGKIEHLTLLGCEVAQGAVGQAFVSKLQKGIGADLVKAFDESVYYSTQSPYPGQGFFVLPVTHKKKIVAAQCGPGINNYPYQGEYWQKFKCVPVDPAFQFNRIEIQVGKPDKAVKVLKAHFVCQSNALDPNSKVVGAIKGHLNDVNPPPLVDHELWSGDFLKKCTAGVDVYLQPVLSQNKLVIKEAFVKNSIEVGGIVVDPDTGALRLQSDSSSSSDAWLLVTAGIAIATAGAIAFGGGVWYVRRRRMR